MRTAEEIKAEIYDLMYLHARAEAAEKTWPQSLALNIIAALTWVLGDDAGDKLADGAKGYRIMRNLMDLSCQKHGSANTESA